MSNRFLILTTFILLSYSLHAQITTKGLPFIKNYGQEIINASDQCYSLIQDKRGMLLVGNYDGLLEFDGINWNLINVPNSQTYILSKSKNDKIFIGGFNEFGYLDSDSSGKLSYRSLIEKIPLAYRKFSQVLNIYCFEEESQVVICENYVLIIGEAKTQIINTKTKFINSFFINNHIYIQEKGTGLFYLENDKLVSIEGSGIFKDINIYAIIPFDTNKVIIAANKMGLFLYDGKSFISWETEANNYIKKCNGNCGSTYLGKYFVFGFTTEGALIIDRNGNIVQWLNKERGLLSNYISDILEDGSSGNLWLSSDLGVSFVEIFSPLYYLSSNLEFDTKAWTATYKNDKLYIGGYPHVYIYDWNNYNYIVSGIKNRKNIQELDGIRTYGITAIDNEIMFTTGNGLYSMKNNNIYQVIPDIFSFTTSPFYKENDFAITLATTGCFISQKINNRWEFRNKVKGVDLVCYQAIPNKKNDFWLLTRTGQYRLKINEKKDSAIYLKPCRNNFGFEDANDNFAIFKKNDITYGFSGKGIYLYHQKTDSFTIENDLNKHFNGNFPKNFFGNNDEYVFYAVGKKFETGPGAIDINNIQNSYNIQSIIQKITTVKGISDAFCPINKNEIVLGYAKGALIFNPEFKVNYKTYHTLIRSVQLFEKDSTIFNGIYSTGDSLFTLTQKTEKVITFRYNENAVRFIYSSLSYENPEKNLFSYKLYGFDKDWSKWESETKKEYTNLPKGSYNFLVKSKNIYGIEGNIASYKFNILPPWWGTWLFKSFTIISIFLLFLGFYFFRINQLKRQQELLENLVNERTHVIEEKNIILNKQSNELNENNILLHDRQQQIEKQIKILLNQSDQLNKTNSLLRERQQFIEEQAEKLKLTNDQLKILNATKDKFFSIIAHDLRNPFNNILGFTEILNNGEIKINEEEKKEIIEQLYLSATSTYNLLENLLEWSRTQSNKIIFKPQLVDINNICLEVIDNLNSNSKNILIQYLPTGKNEIMIDVNMFKTILRNLISNAIKFSHNYSSVTVKTEKNSENITLTVSDNGIGIKNEYLDKIFDFTQKFSSLGTAQEKGSGLGLILCKEFVEKHGGHIWVESELGKGSDFKFSIPITA
jgi:signal transduction histidine kinase